MRLFQPEDTTGIPNEADKRAILGGTQRKPLTIKQTFVSFLLSYKAGPLRRVKQSGASGGVGAGVLQEGLRGTGLDFPTPVKSADAPD